METTPPINVDEAGIALAGYDPVSYFVGDSPQKGDPAITAEHGGATYRFASEANRETFTADPEKYAPQYGGWCATAISENKTFGVDPENYLVEDDKLFVFYKGEAGDTKPQWEEDKANRRSNADQHWSAGDLELHHLDA